MTEQNITLTEVPQEVLDLRAKVESLEQQMRLKDGKIVHAHRFVTAIGERLKYYAEQQDWCDKYDDELREIDDGSGLAEAFIKAAQHEKKELRTFRVEIEVSFESDSYDYSLSASDTCSEEGTYLVPVGMDIADLDDLDNDEIEHDSGTDLVRWVQDADDLDVSVSVDVYSFE